MLFLLLFLLLQYEYTGRLVSLDYSRVLACIDTQPAKAGGVDFLLLLVVEAIAVTENDRSRKRQKMRDIFMMKQRHSTRRGGGKESPPANSTTRSTASSSKSRDNLSPLQHVGETGETFSPNRIQTRTFETSLNAPIVIPLSKSTLSSDEDTARSSRKHQKRNRSQHPDFRIQKPLHISYVLTFIALFMVTIPLVSKYEHDHLQTDFSLWQYLLTGDDTPANNGTTTNTDKNSMYSHQGVLVMHMMPVDYNHLDPVQYMDIPLASRSSDRHPDGCTTHVRLVMGREWALQTFQEDKTISQTSQSLFSNILQTSTEEQESFYIYYSQNSNRSATLSSSSPNSVATEPTAVAFLQRQNHGGIPRGGVVANFHLRFVRRPPLQNLSDDHYTDGTLTIENVCRGQKVQWKHNNVPLPPSFLSDIGTPNFFPQPVLRTENQESVVNLATFSLVVFLHSESFLYENNDWNKKVYIRRKVWEEGQIDVDERPGQTYLEHISMKQVKQLLEESSDDLVAIVLQSISDTFHDEQQKNQSHLEDCELSVVLSQLIYPHANIYWMLPFAIHPYRFVQEDLVDQGSHFFQQDQLRQKELELMEELEIPVIDLYDFTYMYAEETTDGIHYPDNFVSSTILPSLFLDETSTYHAEIYSAFDKDVADR